MESVGQIVYMRLPAQIAITLTKTFKKNIVHEVLDYLKNFCGQYHPK